MAGARPLSYPPNRLLYKELLTDRSFKYSLNQSPDKQVDPSVRSYVAHVLDPYAERLIGNGVARLEKSQLTEQDGRVYDVYRINNPFGYHPDNNQQSWLIYFDRNSELSKLKELAEPIRNMFGYRGELFVLLSSWTNHISIYRLSKLAQLDSDRLKRLPPPHPICEFSSKGQ